MHSFSLALETNRQISKQHPQEYKKHMRTDMYCTPNFIKHKISYHNTQENVQTKNLRPNIFPKLLSLDCVDHPLLDMDPALKYLFIF